MPELLPGILKGIPIKGSTPKSYLKSSSDASEGHKTSTNLSVRTCFGQFSDWQGKYFGQSQETPGWCTEHPPMY